MVGYNIGHCLPGANTATWLDYSGINAARLFAAFSEWCPDELFDAGVGVTDVADFDARVDSLRADPQGTRFIQWPALLERFRAHVYENTNHYQLEFELTKLKDLGITPILEAAEPAWNRPWSGLWLQFQKHYAFTFYCASRFDVEHFNFLNEPDHPSVADDIVTQEIYVRGLQIASHAVHCAVEDVNTAFGKALSPKVQAPVITHVSQASGDYHMDADPDSDHRDDVHGWGEISLLNLRTDYHGATVEPDLFDIFDTHQYNHTAETFTDEIGMMKAKMQRYAPTGTALPIVYSEFNRRNTGAFETSRDSLVHAAGLQSAVGDLAGRVDRRRRRDDLLQVRQHDAVQRDPLWHRLLPGRERRKLPDPRGDQGGRGQPPVRDPVRTTTRPPGARHVRGHQRAVRAPERPDQCR